MTIELHDGDGDPFWQESMFVAWYDRRRGIGGAHRVGQEITNGTCNVWSALFTQDGRRWRQDLDGLPLLGEHRTGQRLGAGSTAFVSKDTTGDVPALGVEVRDDDVQVDLAFEGFYDAMPVWNSPESKDAAATIAPNHAESSGRAQGTVRLGEQTFEVDAVYHRDHSWGARDWSTIVSHRWFVGTFGPQLSFSSTVLQAAGNRWIRGGAVVRHGEITRAESVDIMPFVEPDGVSHRGGRVQWQLEGGEKLTMHCDLVDGAVFRQKSFLLVEGLCEVRLEGSDEVGFCDLEMSNGVGERVVNQAIRAVASNGLSRR